MKLDRFAKPMLIACSLLIAAPASAEKLALTFDDLPLNGALRAGKTELDLVNDTVAVLKARKVPPVFGFVNTQRIASSSNGAAALRRWVESGQRVGNHSYSHFDLNTHSVADYVHDIVRNEPTLAALSPQQEWRWFRYPYLREGDAMEKRAGVRAFLREHGYRVAQTTMDYEDYLWNTPFARCADKGDKQAIARLRATSVQATVAAIAASRSMAKTVFGREINHVLLLHLGAFTPEILPTLLDVLRDQGFELVTLEVAQSDPAFQSDPNYLGKRGGTLLEQHVLAKQITDSPWLPLPREELDALCR